MIKITEITLDGIVFIAGLIGSVIGLIKDNQITWLSGLMLMCYAMLSSKIEKEVEKCRKQK